MNPEAQQSTKEVDILEIMIEFFKGFVNQYFPDREDVGVYLKKKKIAVHIPNDDQSDAILVRCTRLDESTVSVTVYMESSPEAKLYMGHYNKSCDDMDRNRAKLSKLGVDILIPISGNKDVKAEPNAPDIQSVNIEDIVRVTSVETVKVMEHHVLAVGFDGQAPVSLSVPKEQLSAFSIGNKMVRMPFGFQLLEKNPTVH